MCIFVKGICNQSDSINLNIKCAWPLYLANGTFNLISKISSQVQGRFCNCFAFTSSHSAGRTVIFILSLNEVSAMKLLCVADLCFLEGGQFCLLVRCYRLVFHVIILWGQNSPLILRESKSSTSSKVMSF